MKAVATASGHIPEASLSLRSFPPKSQARREQNEDVDLVDRHGFHIVVERADGERARSRAEQLRGRGAGGGKELA